MAISLLYRRILAVAAAARDPAVFDAAVDLGLAGGTADWHAVRAITRELVLGARPEQRLS